MWASGLIDNLYQRVGRICDIDWSYQLTMISVAVTTLTLKRLGHFFQNVILFSNLAHQKCNIFVWKWFNTMNVWSPLWILMAWCFSTRASVTTVLTTHPCVSRCLRVNSSPPSAAYMRQCIGSALVQIMACHLFGTKPLSKPMLGYCHPKLRNKLQWNFNQNTKLLINEIAFENIVCKMTTIFSRG